MDDFCRVNLAVQTTEPNGMICDIHVGYEPIASSRIPRHVHVAYSGRVGDASSVMDDMCPVKLLTWLRELAVLTTNQTA